MPNSLIFDVGDVLFNTIPDRQYQKLAALTGKTPSYVKYRLEEDPQLIAYFECGFLDRWQFREEVEILLADRIPQVDFDSAWSSVIGKRNAELVTWLTARASDIPFAIASNTNELHWEQLLRDDYFVLLIEKAKHCFCSHTMGVAKPDPRFFQLIISFSNGAFRNGLFCDDNEKNLISASDAEFLTIRYHVEESSSELKRIILA